MLNMEMKRCLAFLVVTAITFFNILIPLPAVQAADHAESTSVAGDPGADIGDVYAYLDPKDNTKVILAIDVEGFVVPSEGLNLSFFGPDILYRFEIENTGDSIADTYLDITFSPQTSRSAAQTATISLPTAPGARTRRFEAPTMAEPKAVGFGPDVLTLQSVRSDAEDEPGRRVVHVGEPPLVAEVDVRQPLEQLGAATLLDPGRAVHHEVLVDVLVVPRLRLVRQHDAGVAADVLELALVGVQVCGDDVVTVHARPDADDVRAAVRVQRDDVGEVAAGDHLAGGVVQHGHGAAPGG